MYLIFTLIDIHYMLFFTKWNVKKQQKYIPLNRKVLPSLYVITLTLIDIHYMSFSTNWNVKKQQKYIHLNWKVLPSLYVIYY